MRELLMELDERTEELMGEMKMQLLQELKEGAVEESDGSIVEEQRQGAMLDAKVGRQSPFRQKLTNLNKAVKRWLLQVENGELSNPAIEERIRTSPVAEHLREKHGSEFNEDEFVHQTLSRASRS